MKGVFRIVHDSDAAPSDVAAVLERLSVDPVGEFERIDYSALREREFPKTADESVDLVTMMQGLHHLPPASLPLFLKGVFRILRPGGLFLVREHDMRSELLRPVLDCAHMVFNAVTGVPPALERSEIRGFRSLTEWRAIIESSGLVDAKVYEMQQHDCTVDVMMAFRRPGELPPGRTLAMSLVPPAEETAATKLAAALPKIAVSTGLGLVNSIMATLPKIREFIINTIKLVTPTLPGVSSALSSQIEKTVDGYLEMLGRFQPLTEASAPAAGGGPSFVPDEVFLLIPILRIRAKQGGLIESVIVDAIDKISEAMNPPEPPKQTGAAPREAVAHISPAAFDAEIAQLVARFPALADVHTVVAESGASPKAIEIVQGLVTTENLGEIRSFLLEKMDPVSWNLLVDSFRRVSAMPKLKDITAANSPWNSAAIAVLGHVNLTWTQQVGMSSVGLGSAVTLWKTAVELKKQREMRDPANVDPATLAQMRTALDAMADSRTISIKVGAKPLEDISDVLLVEKATLHAHSLTRLLSDTETNVLEQVAATHAGISGVLALSDLRLPATWRVGSHTLSITYRMVPESISSAAVDKLVSVLGSANLMDTEWRKDNNLFTWLKLPEWMQAETIQLFGNSMNHTPFYRFPFMESVENIISVLAQETRLCASKFGWAKTLLSDAFITDLVGVVICTLGLGALNLAAKPILMVTGADYPQDTLIERLLVTAPRKTQWPPSIRDARELTSGVWLLTVGTFKHFTPALMDLAKMPACHVLQVSNNSELQVRIAAPSSELPKLVKFGPLATQFAYPTVGGVANDNQICLQVETRVLLDCLRFCAAKSYDVNVYDLYSY